MRGLKNQLMGNIAWAPEGFGGYGGGGDDGGGADLGDLDGGAEGFDDLDTDGLDTDSEITLDEPNDFLAELFKEEPPDPNAAPVDPYASIDSEFPKQEDVTNEILASIEGFSLPEDIIPDDFNPNDPKQLRAVMADSARHGMQAAISTMFKPIEIAMRRNERIMNQRIQDAVKGGISQDKTQDTLEKFVPAVKDPAMRATVENLFTQARKKEKDPAKAAQMVARGMKAMGMNPQGRTTPAASRGNPLDSYAPLPRIPNRSSAARSSSSLKR